MSIRVERPKSCVAEIEDTSRDRVASPNGTVLSSKVYSARHESTAGVHISCQGCPLHERDFSRKGPDSTLTTRKIAVGRDASTWLSTLCEAPGRGTYLDNVLAQVHAAAEKYRARQS